MPQGQDRRQLTKSKSYYTLILCLVCHSFLMPKTPDVLDSILTSISTLELFLNPLNPTGYKTDLKIGHM